MTPIAIDFIADLCCPWCYVSWRALDRAIAARPDLACDRRWGVFMLRPDTPAEGIDRKAYMARLFEGQPEKARASRAALQAAADDAECPLDLDAATVLASTMNAHRLIVWASGQGLRLPMIDMLFAAYFVAGLNIGDTGVLVDLARDVGLDGDIVRELLEGEQDWALVADGHNAAVKAGVRGVPVVIFNRTFARQGAESVASYARCLDAATV